MNLKVLLVRCVVVWIIFCINAINVRQKFTAAAAAAAGIWLFGPFSALETEPFLLLIWFGLATSALRLRWVHELWAFRLNIEIKTKRTLKATAAWNRMSSYLVMARHDHAIPLRAQRQHLNAVIGYLRDAKDNKTVGNFSPSERRAICDGTIKLLVRKRIYWLLWCFSDRQPHTNPLQTIAVRPFLSFCEHVEAVCFSI